MTAEAAATGPHVLRRINVAGVLQALRDSPDLTARVSDLTAATGLSRPAVTRALAHLADAGLVASLGVEPHQAGRPAVRVRFRAEAGHVAGIDIGPHTMALVIADLAGAPQAERRVPIAPAPTGPDLVRILRTELADLAGGAGVPASGLWAVAVGTPGVVDHGRGEVVLAPSIPGWTGLPMLAGLREWLDCPVLLDNDVNLAVLAEQRTGDAAPTLLYVHWGERIGTGLVIDGRPHRGAGSAAGELGFVDLATPIDRTPEPAADGLGAFERLAGAEAIRRLAVESCDASLAAALRSDPDLRPLFQAAADGDPAAPPVVETAAARFARGLAVHLLLVDPGVVVVGGGLAHGGDLLLDAVRRHLEPLVLAPFEMRISGLQENAVVTGAVWMALDHAEKRLATLLG
ncbi:ROK family transcriptional regulator [Catenulispora subtropica]|uniref:ROK family transcriptional regulator n=1 Tax=Catenulispora subtropica TaxID=450798 RepID=A0ABN2RWG6_9ACTN